MSRLETWEQLQARLFHLGWLGEELPGFVARPSGGWLYRQILGEAAAVVALASQYIAETEHANDPRPQEHLRGGGCVAGTVPDTGSRRAGGEAL